MRPNNGDIANDSDLANHPKSPFFLILRPFPVFALFGMDEARHFKFGMHVDSGEYHGYG